MTIQRIDKLSHLVLVYIKNTASITLLQKVQKDYYLVIANEHFESYCRKSYSCTDFNLIYEPCWHIVIRDLNIGQCKEAKRVLRKGQK